MFTPQGTLRKNRKRKKLFLITRKCEDKSLAKIISIDYQEKLTLTRHTDDKRSKTKYRIR